MTTGKVLISGADGVPLPAQPGVTDKLSGIIKKAGDGGRTGIIDEGGYAGAFHRVEALPWTVVSLQSRSEAFGAQERSFYGFLFFAAISLFASLGLAYVLSEKISNPIARLSEGAGKIAAGDFSGQVAETGWAEVKMLTAVFNKMVKDLKKYNGMQVDRIVEEKNKAETLVNTIQDGVILTDVSGSLLYSNPTAMRLMGLAGTQGQMVMIPGSVRKQEFREGIAAIMGEKPSTKDIEVVFQADAQTKAVIMIGEIGGSAEEDAARYIKKEMTKPVFCFVAGKTAPPGRRMGHAGAIVEGNSGTHASKVEALAKAGWPVEKPKATIYVWAPVPEKYKGSSAVFAEELLEKAGVVVTPGLGYGQWGEGFYRISLTYPDVVIQEALGRIRELGR